MKQLKALLLVALLASPLFADSEIIGPFGTLNNTDTSFIIPAGKTPDALNVDITPGGKSVKKRKGYATAFTLQNATSPLHGIYNFYDALGNDVSLFFNDRNLNVSVNGGSPAVTFSTGTNGATYQCVDSAGFAYCTNTGRTSLLKISASTSVAISNVNSTGTIVAVTPERLVMAGFSEAPSRIDFSKANDFATWTVGGDPTSPVTFTIVSPGSRITHLTYAHGRLYWFKESSFGYILPGPTLGDWTARTVNSFVGTLYNTSVFRDDILYFQGQDGHFYAWNGSSLTKLSREIQATISAAQGRTSNSFVITSQNQWLAGVATPTYFPDTTTSVGDLLARTTNFNYTSAGDWGSGTLGDGSHFIDTVTVSGQIQSTFPDEFTSFRNGANGTLSVWPRKTPTSGCTISNTSGLLTFTNTTTGGLCLAMDGRPYTALSFGTTFYLRVNSLDSPSVNSNYASFYLNTSSTTSDPSLGLPAGAQSIEFNVARDLGAADSTSAFVLFTPGTTGTGGVGTIPVDVFIYFSTGAWQLTVGTTTKTGTYTGFTSTTPVYAYLGHGISGDVNKSVSFDRYSVSPQTFTYTSSSLNTGYSTNTFSWGILNSSETGNGSINYASIVSADNLTFSSATSLSNLTSITSARNQYIKVVSTFTMNVASGTPLGISSYQLGAYSSGTWVSSVTFAQNISAWDAVNETKSDNGGSHSFYIRAATGSFPALSSARAWTAIAQGGVPSISTGSFIQMRDDFILTNSTQNPKLSDITINWFEGSASDKTYATYHNDALWWSFASGAGATSNNKIVKYDFLNQGFLLYDIPTNGLLVRGQSLYFGSPSVGKVFKFGEVDTDNGAAINAYWKSKDTFGSNPFIEKDYNRLSLTFLTVANSSMTVTYTINNNTATSYTVPLSRAADTFGRYNRNFPLGSTGQTINVKFGNNAADQPFEVFGGQIDSTPKAWNPTQ